MVNVIPYRVSPACAGCWYHTTYRCASRRAMQPHSCYTPFTTRQPGIPHIPGAHMATMHDNHTYVLVGAEYLRGVGVAGAAPDSYGRGTNIPGFDFGNIMYESTKILHLGGAYTNFAKTQGSKF